MPESSGSDADDKNGRAGGESDSAAGEGVNTPAEERTGQEEGSQAGQAQGSPEEAAEKSGDPGTVQSPETAEKEEMIPALNREPEVAEIPWEYEDYRISPGELKKKPAKKSRESENRQAERDTGRLRKSVRNAAPVPAMDHAVFEDRSFEVSSVEESIFSQEKMQETIARGLRNLENYDPYLRQETDGQYAMVIQEDPKPEKQITGQLNLEEIMNEWEKVKRDFYEYNGLEDDSPPQKPVNMQTVRGGANRENNSSTKSWDPGEVHKALTIRDNDEENAGYDTSLFVTEGGGSPAAKSAAARATAARAT